MSSTKKKAASRKKQPGNRSAGEKTAAPNPGKNLPFLPVVIALAVIPLIVHLVVVRLNPQEAALFGTISYGDLFSQAKAALLLVFAGIIALIALVRRKKIFQKPDRLTLTYLIAGGIFILFALLSSILSKYPSIAFWGVHDRAEGFVTILCYFVLFFYTIYAYRTEQDGRRLLTALGIVVTVASVLGVFQYSGHDLLTTGFGRALAIFPGNSGSVAGINLQSDAGNLYGTFYHHDYVGSFAAITVPLFLILAVYAKSPRSRILLWGMELLSLWLLLGSTSRAGIVGVAAALVFCIVFFAKILARKWKISLSCVALIFLVAVGLNFASKGRAFSRVPSLAKDIASVFQPSSAADYLAKLPVKNVYSKGNTAVIVTQKGDILNGSLKNNSITLTDGNGKPVSVQEKNKQESISDKRFQRFGFSFVGMGPDNTLGLAVTVDGQPQFYFRVGSGMNLQMTNASGTEEIDSIKNPPSFGFKGKERLGSARGYIWSRANAMVPAHLVIGAGPDTFAWNFPQNDLLGKYWAYGTTNMLVDKPHDLYLQILLSEGGIALLAFLTIVLAYLVDSIRLYALKRTFRPDQIFGAAVSIGIAGYLFAGFFNDSVVSVAPVFWIMLGAGIAVNLRNHKKAAEPSAGAGPKQAGRGKRRKAETP